MHVSAGLFLCLNVHIFADSSLCSWLSYFVFGYNGRIVTDSYQGRVYIYIIYIYIRRYSYFEYQASAARRRYLRFEVSEGDSDEPILRVLSSKTEV